jgi:alkanesulfonate monooxygenase SsuD/methylene tetrahydromethanopterin reductase-like flavin-dependent oxidoreductase (luciferase family)
MIDMISQGRLVSGIVRGAGQESICLNSNPAYNRERFDEAHNLLVKAMTDDGPFVWEGEHFQYRVVNPWVRVLQRPHPRIWVPGVLSPETLIWAAEHRYPYIGLGTALHSTVELWNLYQQTAAREGYVAGPENFGYLQQIHVSDTEEKAQEEGKAALFGGGAANFSRPEWTLPPGYNSKEATRRLARQATEYGFLGITSEKLAEQRGERRDPNEPKGHTRERLMRGEVSIEEAKQKIYAQYQKAQDGLQIVIGTPKTVIPRLKLILEVLRPGVMGLFQAQGPLTTEQRMNSIRLMGQEVLPALREIAKGLGIVDPFERQPGSRQYIAGTQLDPLVDLDALKRAPKRDESVRV